MQRADLDTIGVPLSQIQVAIDRTHSLAFLEQEPNTRETQSRVPELAGDTPRELSAPGSGRPPRRGSSAGARSPSPSRRSAASTPLH